MRRPIGRLSGLGLRLMELLMELLMERLMGRLMGRRREIECQRSAKKKKQMGEMKKNATKQPSKTAFNVCSDIPVIRTVDAADGAADGARSSADGAADGARSSADGAADGAAAAVVEKGRGAADDEEVAGAERFLCC